MCLYRRCGKVETWISLGTEADVFDLFSIDYCLCLVLGHVLRIRRLVGPIRLGHGGINRMNMGVVEKRERRNVPRCSVIPLFRSIRLEAAS